MVQSLSRPQPLIVCKKSCVKVNVKLHAQYHQCIDLQATKIYIFRQIFFHYYLDQEILGNTMMIQRRCRIYLSLLYFCPVIGQVIFFQSLLSRGFPSPSNFTSVGNFTGRSSSGIGWTEPSS